MDKYFVVSNGDSPDKIFFDLQEAFNTEATFVDVFDENGEFVRAYKFVENRGYTQDF